MAVICREKKMLFILNPRTGSSALGEHLINEFGGEWLPKTTIVNKEKGTQVEPKHNTVQKLLDFNLITQEELKEYLVFTSVASPYDSLQTLYNKYRYRYPEWRKEGRWFLQNDRIKQEIEFCAKHNINEWARERFLKSAVKSILGLERYSINENYLDGCKEILRKNYLQSDFSAMLQKYQISGNPKIPVINQTEEKEEEKTSFNAFSKLLIYLTYKSDF
jgi:hypothetical protein